MAFPALLANVDRAVRQQLDGRPITYAPGAGVAVIVTGVFDRAYVLVGTDIGEAGVSSTGPAVFLSLTDLPTDPEVDAACAVIVDGVAYKPHTVKPDGLGGVLLLLHLI